MSDLRSNNINIEPNPASKEDVLLPIAGDHIRALNDAYSDRLRCDHPDAVDGQALGEALLETARELDRGRVVVLANEQLANGLEAGGLALEARIPGFYRGESDCVVMGAALNGERLGLGQPQQVEQVLGLLGQPKTSSTHAKP